MLTPNGGVRSEVIALLGGVQIDDPSLADYLEIIEYDADDNEIMRTYAGTIVGAWEDPEPKPFITISDDDYNGPENADQLKTTWDIYTSEPKLVETLDELLDALGLSWNAASWEVVANMTALPVWDVAPDGLKAEVDAWLSSAQ